MRVIYRFFAVMLFICLSQQALASDIEEIQKVLSLYWTAYTDEKFQESTRFIYPDDLESMKNELLPVFLQAVNSPDPEIKGIAEKLFNGVPINEREKMTSAEVYSGLQNLIFSLNPDAIKTLKGTSLTVTETFFSNPDSAAVTCNILVAGTVATDQERLGKVNGVWYVRFKESPKDTAEKFKKLFTK